MVTAPRATPEERLEAWLAWQAVRDGFHGEEALRYMDVLRGTFAGHRAAIAFELQEAFHQIAESSKRGRITVWLSRRLGRLFT